MAKRGNGQGAVYLRGDGRWEAQIRLAGGRRKSVYGPTRREVVRRLREARWLLAQGLVERVRDEQDWRVVWVLPTERGQRAVALYDQFRRPRMRPLRGVNPS